MTDEEAQRAMEDDPEIVPTNAEFWKNAKLVPPLAGPHTIRLESDPPSRTRPYTKRPA